MKQLIQSMIFHKDLYVLSFSLGGVATAISSFFVKNTPSDLFGIGIFLWLIIFGINLIDIHTGIKADTVNSKKENGSFVFKSRKGWRALEKVFVFTFVIAFLYFSEKEVYRVDFPTYYATILIIIKYILFFYIFFVEVQSIGENQELRHGKKPKVYMFLDLIIYAVNEGIMAKINSFFNSKLN